MEKDLTKKKWFEYIIIAVAFLGVGIGIGWQFAEHQYEEAVMTAQWQQELSGPPANDSSTPTPVENAPEIVVYVVGCVEKPGVVHLSEGARVYEAVEEAIPLAEAKLESVPMARNLVDGETIVVPGENDEPTEISTANTSVSGGKININTASAKELQNALPGIGEKLSMRIVTYRETNGNFATERDICNVSGIGESIYSQIADLITVK